MYNETEFERLHQCFLCPRKYYWAYCLLDGWYENELVHSSKKGVLRRLLLEFLCSLPTVLLFSILIWYSFNSDKLLKISMIDCVIILSGLLGFVCLHEIVWGYTKRYLNELLSYCSREQTKRDFVLATNRFCKIQKEDATFLGIALGVLISIAMSFFALAIFSLEGVDSQNATILKEWLLLAFCSTFFSTLITITYSQYRFFNHLSAGLEMILASKQAESDGIDKG